MDGRNLRAERARLGLTKIEAANDMGVGKNAISRWESGKATPTVKNLYLLARFYECTPDYPLGLTNDRHGSMVGMTISSK